MRRDRLTTIREAAERIHAGDVDKQGRPYIEHLAAVADAVSDAAKPVAWMHDAIEDHPSFETLATAGRLLNRDELRAVLLLTREVDEPYADYIAFIATSRQRGADLAREVKLADVRDNLGRLTPELEQLRARYEKALTILGPAADN